MDPRRTRRRGVTTAGAALAAVVVGAALTACGTSESSPSAGAVDAEVTPTSAGPGDVVVVADEPVSAGTCGGEGVSNWSVVLDEQFRGNAPTVVTDGAESAGFVARDEDGRTLGDLVLPLVGPSTRLVVVMGGAHDTDSRYEVDGAADEMVVRIRSAAPDARIVLVGPLAPGATADSELTAIDETLNRVASRHGARYMSALSWAVGTGLHCADDSGGLTDSGHAAVGERLGRAVTAILR